jgi:hypothetical protein
MRKKPTSPAALVERKQAYYQVTYDEEGERFGAALLSLYETIFPKLATVRTRSRRLTSARRPVSSSARHRLEAIRARDESGFTGEDHARVRAFVREWRLPPLAEQDVWASFFRAQYEDAPPRLIALLPPMHISQRLPKRPIKPDPFLYDPLHDPVDAVDHYLTDLRPALIESAKAQRASAFKQVRRRLLPAPFWHRSHTIAMARRLYRRARLGWSYKKIAEAESPRRTAEDVHAVEVSVREWARMLDMRPLPPSTRRRKAK